MVASAYFYNNNTNSLLSQPICNCVLPLLYISASGITINPSTMSNEESAQYMNMPPADDNDDDGQNESTHNEDGNDNAGHAQHQDDDHNDGGDDNDGGDVHGNAGGGMQHLGQQQHQGQVGNNDEDGGSEGGLMGAAWIVKLRGLPWSVTAQDIMDFLVGVEVSGGASGVHLITYSRNSSRPNGEAFVVCATEESYTKAFEYNKASMGHRYIESKFAHDERFRIELAI